MYVDMLMVDVDCVHQCEVHTLQCSHGIEVAMTYQYEYELRMRYKILHVATTKHILYCIFCMCSIL